MTIKKLRNRWSGSYTSATKLNTGKKLILTMVSQAGVLPDNWPHRRSGKVLTRMVTTQPTPVRVQLLL